MLLELGSTTISKSCIVVTPLSIVPFLTACMFTPLNFKSVINLGSALSAIINFLPTLDNIILANSVVPKPFLYKCSLTYIFLLDLSIATSVNVSGSTLNPKSIPQLVCKPSGLNSPKLQLVNTTPSALSNQPPNILCLYLLGLLSFIFSMFFKNDSGKFKALSK